MRLRLRIVQDFWHRLLGDNNKRETVMTQGNQGMLITSNITI